MRRRMFRLTLSQKRNWAGYLWVSPFIIGFIFFFLAPMLQSFRFSVSELSSPRKATIPNTWGSRISGML